MDTPSRTGRFRRLDRRGKTLVALLLIAVSSQVLVTQLLLPRVTRRRPQAAASTGTDPLVGTQQRILELSQAIAREPDNPRLRVRLAALEYLLSLRLAAIAEDSRFGEIVRSQEEHLARLAWRRRFRRGDPGGCLRRAAGAVREARRGELKPTDRERACELLASICAGLGDHPGETEALAEAVRYSPRDARLWGRLAEAYGRGRRFRDAHAAEEQMRLLLRKQIVTPIDERP